MQTLIRWITLGIITEQFNGYLFEARTYGRDAMTGSEVTDPEEKPDRLDDRRKDQKPGPPYKSNMGTDVEDNRRIRPDPRLDKMIEVEWEDDAADSAAPEDQD